MALTTVEPINGMRYLPVMLGDFGQEQTVSEQETTNELISRGFRSAEEVVPISPPVAPKVVPTIGREEAIRQGVDQALAEYQQPKKCAKVGGCAIKENTFKRIANRAATVATQFLRQGAVTPRAPTITPVIPGAHPFSVPVHPGETMNQWIDRMVRAGVARELVLREAQRRFPAAVVVSPAPLVRVPVSPTPVSPAPAGTARRAGESDLDWTRRLLSMGISARDALQIRLQEKGAVSVQFPTSPAIQRFTIGGNLSPRLRGIGSTLYGLGQAEPPGMTTWDWVGIVASAAGGVATTLEAYANARAERERAGQTATLTADQIKAVVQTVLAENPALSKSAVEAAAMGAGGKAPPKEMPGWVIPVVVGTAVVAVMSMAGRRK
jgi:hypothetical protein